MRCLTVLRNNRIAKGAMPDPNPARNQFIPGELMCINPGVQYSMLRVNSDIVPSGMSPDTTFFLFFILDGHINGACERFCCRAIQHSSDWDLISRERFFLVLF